MEPVIEDTLRLGRRRFIMEPVIEDTLLLGRRRFIMEPVSKIPCCLAEGGSFIVQLML